MKNFFSFNQIGGEYPALADELRRGTPTAVFGVADSLKYLIAAMIEKPVLYITADGVSAQKVAENVAALSGKETAVISAKDEVLLYRKALSKDSLFKRLCGVRALTTGCPFVACEIDALLQLFPKNLPVVSLKEGEDFAFESLAKTLVEMGYQRSYEVESKGSFALRGDILDIYPVNEQNPVRVDFFGDTVEKIKPYDAVSGERLEGRKTLDILSATDVLLSQTDLLRVKEALQKGLKDYKDTQAFQRAQEIADGVLAENGETSFVLPLLENAVPIFQLLPQETVIVFDEGKTLFDKLNALYKEHEERFSRLFSGGEAFAFTR